MSFQRSTINDNCREYMNIITDIEYLAENEEFENCQFEQLDMANALLNSKYFSSSVFIDCNLSNCNMSESTFNDCKFINSDLSQAQLTNAKLQDITFTKCKLMGINWTALEWRERFSKRKSSFKKRRPFPISFDNCILNYSIFIGLDLYAVSFIDSMLKEVGFEDSDLESANFKNTDLTNATFNNTILLKADLSSAKNYTISAYTNKMKGAQFSFPEVMNLVYALDIEISVICASFFLFGTCYNNISSYSDSIYLVICLLNIQP